MRKYASIRRVHSDAYDKKERDIWRWYWSVKFSPHKFKEKQTLMWKYYDRVLKEQKFTNNKDTLKFNLFKPTNIDL